MGWSSPWAAQMPGYKPPKPTPAPAKPAANNVSAKQILEAQLLDPIGLGGLADWAWATYTSVGGGQAGIDLVNSELPQQAAFKARFPGIAAAQAKGLTPPSAGDYLNYETTIRAAFSAHGLPLPTTGPAFNDMIATLIGNGVSAQEVVNQRIGSAYDRVANAPIEVRQAAQQLWGVNGDNALAAFFLSPEHSAPQLEKLSQTAEVLGTAQRFGIGLTADRAGRLVDLGADQNLDRFSQLAQQAPLFEANPGENANLTLENQGVGAAFGEDATSAQQVARRLAQRKAALTGGGQPYTSSSLSATPGIPGLGTGPT